jgi:hypothetical protein
MPRISARMLTYDAMRALGVLRAGQGPNEDAVDDCMRLLNDMIESWAIERLMIYTIEPRTYQMIAGTQNYTLGPGGTLGEERPVRVDGAAIIYPATIMEQPVPLLSLDQYRNYDAGVYLDGAYPLTSVQVRPLPEVNVQLILYNWSALKQFPYADSMFSFPPGYSLALRWNLALQYAPLARIQAKIPDVLYDRISAEAVNSKAAIKSFNSTPPPVMSAVDGGALSGGQYGVFNTYVGQF